MLRVSLSSDLLALDQETKASLEKGGFDREKFLELAATLKDGDAATRRATRNTVRGRVEAPKPEEIGHFPLPGSPEHAKFTQLGHEAMARGELAFCTMAGGMATRMGGIVKALAEVFGGHTFLQMRLAENRTASAKAGRPVPLWLMTSDATDHDIAAALKTEKAPDHVAHFMQNLSLRLTPDGSLFRTENGKPSEHATGQRVKNQTTTIRTIRASNATVTGERRFIDPIPYPAAKARSSAFCRESRRSRS